MASKEETIKMIGRLLKTEENAIPIYLKHITNTLFLSNFNEVDQENLKQKLNILNDDSIRHRDMLINLINKIKDSDSDVY